MDGIPPIGIDPIDLPAVRKRNVTLRMARLDRIHPVISGNKLYKLHFFLNAAKDNIPPLIITAGGAYSNHLVATAFACRQKGMAATGIVRGEKPEELSPTLKDCLDYGMKLHFVSREFYREITAGESRDRLIAEFGPHLFIPEGGFHPLGAAGASLIAEGIRHIPFTHLCTPVGTGTTLAGLSSDPYCQNKKMTGFPALKGLRDIPERFKNLNIDFDPERIMIRDEFHFGGYAQKTPELTGFMNRFFSETGIPTDFVYTGKMMFGVMQMIANGEFPAGSEILCLHTGGLQGNRSLPPGVLEF